MEATPCSVLMNGVPTRRVFVHDTVGGHRTCVAPCGDRPRREVAGRAAECGQLVVATAGGTDDGRSGTSCSGILDALRTADAGAGAPALPDLGGSVLTARLVLEDRPGTHAFLADARFVEGVVAAAMTTASDAEPVTVAEEAEGAGHISKF
ncbi:PTS-dependent dihydroxyacetone kinase phosphotransferase subunit DhaM [Streptomyces angustmyceticus]|uniref:PTS-dependent dihydroxyacetone kinase phosphotransferase subunit DhaM n=1 Tax=Streptomyces angustmyceticus TaxID=285578 RepID=UPI00380A7A35